ncbi:MAG: hypothetical protein E6H66_12855 [Betaproteobacteria bacterium]|nr:MAG: hypothetical protein E6H66_12855 [Betaproteobacteria bacterium]
MNTFKRKSLYAALAGVGALGVTGAAQAVNVNPDGLGQALVYPFYDTQGTSAPYNSLLSVVNSTNSGKVVKVRFLEGRASREVLDFNLWLSAHDVWTTAIIPSGTGAGIFTSDLSCTTPPVSKSSSAPTNFVNFAYAGDPEDQTLARTKEGYIEIIEMGNVTGATLAAITHAQPSPPGVPPGCGGLPVGATAPTDLVPGQGGLFGGISLVNVLAGGDVTEDAIALASFSATTLWAPAGSIQPDLSQVNPKTSVVFNNTEVVTTDWSGSSNTADAVSAVFMHDHVYNEFVLDTGTKSATDWVVTFPTKHFYYNASNNVTKLFQRNFRAGGAGADTVEPRRAVGDQLDDLLAAASDADGFAVLGSERDHHRQHQRNGRCAAVEEQHVAGHELHQRLGGSGLPALNDHRADAPTHRWRDDPHEHGDGHLDYADLGYLQRSADRRLRGSVLQQRHADGTWPAGRTGLLYRQLRSQVHATDPVISVQQLATQKGGTSVPPFSLSHCGRNGRAASLCSTSFRVAAFVASSWQRRKTAAVVALRRGMI